MAAYTAVFAATAMGAGALALDMGRLTVLRAQMQDRADAGAMAGATQLDGRPGAQERATQLATEAMTQTSSFVADGEVLDVESVNFYSAVKPTPVLAKDDSDSLFIEVALTPKRVNFLLANLLTTTDTARSTTLAARSTAMLQPFICEAPPLMICDPEEVSGGFDVNDPANIGRQMRLKPPPSGGSWAPGNFGLLALPDGSSGASDLHAALAAVTPPNCYSMDVTTAPGVKFQQIRDGLNTRFDLPGGGPWPAPDVINFPRDADLEKDPTDSFGDGNWKPASYWATKHGGSLPGALAGATRYQVYLYELGESFARKGKETLWPLEGEVPAGYTVVTPPGKNIPFSTAHPDDPDYDGRPSQAPAPNGPKRRLLKVAVLECVANNVRGKHTYPTNGNFVEVFMTEHVGEAPEGALYGELVRPLAPGVDPAFHANVRLVE